MSSWDRRSPSALVKLRDQALREQIRDVVAPFSPFWKERFSEAGIKPSSVSRVRDLAKVPAVGERDVCPDGDPAKAARLVIQATETGYALHAPGPSLRKALWRRTTNVDAYKRQVEADTRATSYVFAGLGFRFPLASTRSDLDLVARAGARLWQVLGLTSADVLVSALPVAATTEHTAIQYAAIASGSPALHPGAEPDDVAATLTVVPATVLVAESTTAARLIDELADIGAPLTTVQTVVLVGAPTPTERGAVRQALAAAGLPGAVILAAHAPSGARVLWAECRESASGVSAGYHTYPDLDVVQLLDPETGEAPAADARTAELVLTQLGFRGSALLRWRTGDLVAGDIQTGRCPSCGRTTARVPETLARRALVTQYKPERGPATTVDLRALAGALTGRADVADWRGVLRTSQRHGADELLVHVVPTNGADPAEATVAVARDLRTAAGTLPSQVIAATPEDLAVIDADGRGAQRVTRRLSVRE
jgi:phenylacetate-coenzyme A ligase PaaK-like adenylate-forming protein